MFDDGRYGYAAGIQDPSLAEGATMFVHNKEFSHLENADERAKPVR
ncbi:hypothetical protein [Mycolicibacter senuensis]|nr:hypothetical protein [Mycolicibacter senuensis]